jgi:hypothetical protein
MHGAPGPFGPAKSDDCAIATALVRVGAVT